MAVGVRNAEIQKHDAIKERVRVKWDHAEYDGWLIDWSGRSEHVDEQTLAMVNLSVFKDDPPSHLLVYDDGEFSPVVLRGGGWLMDSDGDKHRLKLMGSREFVDSKRNEFRCEKCQSVFLTKHALAVHMNGKWCRNKNDMSEQQLRRLRGFRQVSEKRMGMNRLAIEPANVFDINGKQLQAVGEFKYLGTMVTNHGGATREVTRRILLSASVMTSLRNVWSSSVLSLRLKLRLFSAIVTSILLYNSESWSITANDVRLLEGFYFRCLRQITRSIRCKDLSTTEIDKASHAEVFRVANVPSLATILRQKRLRWLGHLIRSDQGDPARICLFEEVDSGSPWWKLLLSDLREIGLSSFHAAEIAALDRASWRDASCARPGH